MTYRPRGKPHFGGHIERMMDTLATLVHEQPGTTFHNPQDRGVYRSQEQAIYTLREFETWLLVQITGVYHQRLHKGIGTTPLQRYKDDLMGSAQRPGVGLPILDVDPQRLRLDLLPFFEHTVQAYGVRFKNIYYYDPVLQPWVEAPDPDHVRQKRKFVFRYDPRNLSEIYFFDPQLKEYLPVGYRDLSRPAISLWELRAAYGRIQEAGRAAVDEDALFAAHQQARDLQAQARTQTRRHRKHLQRERTHESALTRPASSGTDSPTPLSGEESFTARTRLSQGSPHSPRVTHPPEAYSPGSDPPEFYLPGFDEIDLEGV